MTLLVKCTTAMRSRGLRLWRIVSAASRAMATRLPRDMEPDASSTSVTFSGVSSRSSGAWKATRARCRPPPRGCSTTSLLIAKLRSSLGAA